MAALFIDESKEPNYVLAATFIEDADAPRIRKIIQAERRSGQRSIHFKKEDPNRRKQLVAIYERHEIQTYSVTSATKNARAARQECFETLIEMAIEKQISRLVIERDDSIFKADELMLAVVIKSLGGSGSIGFEHLYRHEEPLLWIADSIAWCENKGGDWRKLITPQIVRL